MSREGAKFLVCKEVAAAAAKSLQSCPTLCDPIDRSPPGSSIPGILQARILEWVAISFSNAWKWKVKGKSLSHVWLLETPWTAAHQAPPSMGFSRQEYWSGVPLPSPAKKLREAENGKRLPLVSYLRSRRCFLLRWGYRWLVDYGDHLEEPLLSTEHQWKLEARWLFHYT